MAPEEEPRPSFGPILLIIGGIMVVLTVVFGFTVIRNSRQFSEYRTATLLDPDHPPRWETQTLSVDECIDEAISWGMECPGVASWCQAEIPPVMRTCLESSDRTAYCEEVGDEVMSTRFGYHECEERREDVEGKYARRGHKKYCALSYRAVAGHCQDGPARVADAKSAPGTQ